MVFQSLDGLGVLQFGITKHFTTDRCQAGIVFQQFGSRVDVVMVVIVLAIVIKPGLNPFGKIFVVIDGSILPFPQAGVHRFAITFLQAFVEGWIDILQASQMNVVRDFVDQDAFGRIRIAVISEQVLFAAGAIRVAVTSPGTTGSRIPEILGRKTLHIRPGSFPLTQTSKLRQVSREFVVSDNAEPCPAADHGLQNIRPTGQHHVDQKLGLFQCIRVDVLRCNNRQAIRTCRLRVKSRSLVRCFRVKPKPLDDDFAGHGRLGFILTTNNGKSMPQGGGDRGLLTRFNSSIRNAF